MALSPGDFATDPALREERKTVDRVLKGLSLHR
jgi:hypothetical protein